MPLCPHKIRQAPVALILRASSGYQPPLRAWRVKGGFCRGAPNGMCGGSNTLGDAAHTIHKIAPGPRATPCRHVHAAKDAKASLLTWGTALTGIVACDVGM